MKPLYLFFFLACTNFVFAQGRPVNQKALKPPLGKIKGFTYFEDSTNGFYLKNTEVTIGEYFEFVDWVIDSCARRILAEEYGDDFIRPSTNKIHGDWEIDWNQKYSWQDEEYYPILVQELFLPEHQRFYRKKTFNPKKIGYYGKEFSYYVLPKDFEYPVSNFFPKKNKKNFRESIPKELTNKPISNVSFWQAELFCEWKTQELNKKSKNKQYHCFIPEVKHVNKALNTNYEYCENWLQVYPDELERKIEHINKQIQDSLERKINKLSDSIKILNGAVHLDGVYVQEEIDTINPSRDKFNRVFNSTNDYYAYGGVNNLLGLDDNVSEWIEEPLPMNDSILKSQLIEYKGENIFLGDFNSQYSTLVIGGNWWHGKDNCTKTYINEEAQLETIGFRYAITIKEK